MPVWATCLIFYGYLAGLVSYLRLTAKHDDPKIDHYAQDLLHRMLENPHADPVNVGMTIANLIALRNGVRSVLWPLALPSAITFHLRSKAPQPQS